MATNAVFSRALASGYFITANGLIWGYLNATQSGCSLTFRDAPNMSPDYTTTLLDTKSAISNQTKVGNVVSFDIQGAFTGEPTQTFTVHISPTNVAVTNAAETFSAVRDPALGGVEFVF